MFSDSQRISIIGSLALIGFLAVPRFLNVPSIETPKGADSQSIKPQPALGALERIEARLWSDPFQAVADATKEAAEKGNSSPSKPQDKGCNDSGFDVPAKCLTDRIRERFDSAETRNIASRVDCDFQQEHQLALLEKPARSSRCAADAPSPAVVKLLLVQARSGNSWNAGESRRRVRVALQIAMLSGGWSPIDEAHLGVVRIDMSKNWNEDVSQAADTTLNPAKNRNEEPPPKTECCANRCTDCCPLKRGEVTARELLVPFETFQHPSGAFAVALWLDEDQFETLDSIRNAADQIRGSIQNESHTDCEKKKREGFCKTAAGCDRGFDVSIIGPTGTDNLIPLIAVPTETHHEDSWARLYSPVSSVSAEQIFQTPALQWRSTKWGGNSDCPPHPNERIRCEFASRGVTFIRTVTTDDIVLGKLMEEIDQRRRAVRPRECGLIIVSEADSLYARSFPSQVQTELQRIKNRRSNQGGRHDVDCHLLEIPDSRGLTTYQYLKSVNDARATATLNERRKPSDSSKEKGQEGYFSASRDMVSSGEQQFDYIRRLVDQIVADVSKKRLDTEQVFAVGIFGSDAHDKVSIMRLMRDALPHARFFTTDLDAVLFDPENRPFTRNLIVGSSYSISSPADAHGFPAFRSMQQVSYMKAFKAALSSDIPQASKDEVSVYELGLSGPVNLRTTGPVCQLGQAARARWTQLDGVYQMSVALLIITIVGFTLYFVWRHASTSLGMWLKRPRLVQATRGDRAWVEFGHWAGILIFCVAIAFTIYWWVLAFGAVAESCSGEGEPIFLFEGLSLWAPTLIRGFAIAVGVVALLKFSAEVREWPSCDLTIAGPAAGTGPAATGAKDSPTDAIQFPGLIWWLSVSRQYLGFDSQNKAVASLTESWVQAVRGTQLIGLKAILGGLLLFLAYLALLFVLIDPNVPSRGDYMSSLNSLSRTMGNIVLCALAVAAWMYLRSVRLFVAGASLHLKDLGMHLSDPAEDLIDKRLNLYGTSNDLGRSRLGDESTTRRVRRLVGRVLYLEFINEMTKPVRWFVYVPLVVTSLLVVARWRLFENQTFPASLWIYFTTIVTISILNAWMLSRTAIRARNEVDKDLAQLLTNVRNSDPVDSDVRRQSVRTLVALRQDVGALKTGAYAPLLDQPFIRALIVLLTTGSTLEWINLMKGFG